MIAWMPLVGCSALHHSQRSDPLTPAERLNLGVAYEHEGKMDLALREYQRAETGSLRPIALTYQGNVYRSLGEIDRAREKYDAALEADPDNLMAMNNLAWLLAQQGEDLDRAEQLIRRALEFDPEPREPYESTLNAVLEAR